MGTQISAANSINSLVNQANRSGASSHVINAIQKASYKTGVDFSYLMNKASQESSFDPAAKATTSSATGLFQFTTHTWLHMVKTYGDQYGLGNYASQITVGADGRLGVEDPAVRQAILALRKDPVVSAEMAGEFDKENAAVLQQKVGGTIGNTELYLAHFLGATGASNFINKMRSSPDAVAADILPSAAAANHFVFYTKAGEPRTLQQIYQHFAQKFDGGDSQFASVTPKIAPVGPANNGFNVASAYQVLNNMPTATAATSVTSDAATSGSAFQSRVNAKELTVASATGSTMFNTMILSQMQDMQLGIAPPVSSIDMKGEDKKRNGLFS